MQKVKIIAEIGINHDGNWFFVEEMIRQCVEGGADYVKFQLYDSEKLFGNSKRKKYEFSKNEFLKVVEMCRDYGVEPMASVFDEVRFKWAKQAALTAYKVASRVVADNPDDLCRLIGSLGCVKYVSLGLVDHQRAVRRFKGCENVKFLECVAEYPTPLEEVGGFDTKKHYGVSDHTYGIGYALLCVAHGAKVVEKHFTLDKTSPFGPGYPDKSDHLGSMNLEELKKLRQMADIIAPVAHQIYDID